MHFKMAHNKSYFESETSYELSMTSLLTSQVDPAEVVHTSVLLGPVEVLHVDMTLILERQMWLILVKYLADHPRDIHRCGCLPPLPRGRPIARNLLPSLESPSLWQENMLDTKSPCTVTSKEEASS